MPVLSFPVTPNPENETVNIKHILLTTDLSKEALRPFTPVLELAKSLGAKVTVLHVVPELMAIPHGTPLAPPMAPPDLPEQVAKARKSLETQCASLEGVNAEAISHESPAKGVVEYAKEHGVDLIALSTHGRTGFRRFALGSVPDEVLRRSPIPVLSYYRTED